MASETGAGVMAAESRELHERLPDFRGRRAVVLGDVMLDRFVTGTVRRLSQEAPIPILHAARVRVMLGGAGNVAHNLAALGCHATLVGVVGDDAAGVELRGALARIAGGGIEAPPGTIDDFLVVAAGRPTTVKTRYLAGVQHMLRVDEETTAALDRGHARRVVERFTEAVAGADIVILSDYAKGVLGDAVLRQAIEMSLAAGKMVVVDPKSDDFPRYKGATVLTPNAQEVARATGIDASTDEGAERAARKALEMTGGSAVFVTRSEKGLTLAARGAQTCHLRAEAREVAEVSGAGDTLLAALSAALAAGATFEAAAAIANAAAGISVGKVGTATVSPEELADALHAQDRRVADRKIVALSGALHHIARWRARGLIIGFTNGCFDLIHPGHIDLLTRARATCDRLIVGLNSDESIRRLKGPSRPVQNELARATVMAAIEAVDLVMLFEEDTPLALIEALRPDILVKGADYRRDQVVGGDLVESWGGRVVLVDLVPGHSTTATIARAGAPNPACSRQPTVSRT